MKLDIKIDFMKEKLEKAINTKGVMDKQTIKISQQLDTLIVMRMRRMVA